VQFKKRAPKARVCVNVHNALFRTYGSGEIHRTVDAADLIIFNCHFLANQFLPRLRHGHEKIRVVHNGVDTGRFVPRPELTPKEEVVILFVARMVPEKGADLLIQAACKVHAMGRRFKLRIVGSTGFSANGPLSPFEIELRKMAAPLGQSVEFLPFIDRHRILSVYQSASIFCGPSNYDEPCTLAIPEAMACGVPAIASRRGGIPEIGKEDILYFNPPDTDEFAERLAYLIDDADARAEWGRRARARAEAMDWGVQYRAQCEALGLETARPVCA
jgi:glycosyltransferase involved in cell wall biosynthesis